MPIDPIDPYVIQPPPPEQVTVEGSTSEPEPPAENTSTEVVEEGKGENVDVTV